MPGNVRRAPRLVPALVFAAALVGGDVEAPEATPIQTAPAWAAASTPSRAATCKKKRKKVRKRRSRPTKRATPEPAAPAPAPASDLVPSTSFRGPTRIDFDDRLIQGQTNKSGAVYLFDRKETGISSMVKRRKSFRRLTIQTIYDR